MDCAKLSSKELLVFFIILLFSMSIVTGEPTYYHKVRRTNQEKITLVFMAHQNNNIRITLKNIWIKISKLWLK